MNNVVILLGTQNAGKSKTIKTFFGWQKKTNPHSGTTKDFKIMNIDGRCTPVFVETHGSPQEHNYSSTDERVVSDVMKDIKRRLDNIEKTTKWLGLDSFVLLLPFSIIMKRGKLNESSILKPIEELRKTHNVLIVHLKGGISGFDKEAEKFIKNKIETDATIESEEKYKEQANKLKIILKNLVV